MTFILIIVTLGIFGIGFSIGFAAGRRTKIF